MKKRIKWLSIITVGILILLVIAGKVALAGGEETATPGSSPQPSPATTAPEMEIPTPTTVSEPSSSATSSLAPSAPPEEGPITPKKLAPIPATSDPLVYAGKFAEIWLAPNPTAYSHKQFTDWVLAELTPHPTHIDETLDVREHVQGQILIEEYWETQADYGLLQQATVGVVEKAGFLYGTPNEAVFENGAQEQGWGNLTLVDVWATCDKEENGSHLSHSCRALLIITCQNGECGLADIATDSLNDIPGAATYTPQGWAH